jgi:acyl CoA:acetate/3-ketoacid CoA transferase beta subunit
MRKQMSRNIEAALRFHRGCDEFTASAASISRKTRAALSRASICRQAGVFEIDRKQGNMRLLELAPAVTIDDVKAKTEANFAHG